MRVYRRNRDISHSVKCFLTVCEGVSTLYRQRTQSRQFPHCMWGYIIRACCIYCIQCVPSLYVMVYRGHKCYRWRWLCSLTVCEGVSLVGVTLLPQQRSLTVCEGVSRLYQAFKDNAPFPHCMWGYIVISDTEPFCDNVPSLYVRVYRECCWFIPGGRRSLIICEGISKVKEEVARNGRFPHYMWGYIEPNRPKGCYCWVPSLYVRVYREKVCNNSNTKSSLIICEGISSALRTADREPMFPHYMWGYIDIADQLEEESVVPSLYVMVYHIFCNINCSENSSLIICEGISMITCSRSCCLAFPHYMWGYIAPQVILIITGKVPSLYVRVYLLIFLVSQYRQSSLIICEGISH